MSRRSWFGALLFSFAHVAAAQNFTPPPAPPARPRAFPAPTSTLPPGPGPTPAPRTSLDPNRSLDQAMITPGCPTALTQREVAGLPITEAEYAEASGRARAMAEEMVAITKAPYSGLVVNLNTSFSRDSSAQERVSRFVNGNNLFNRFVSESMEINPALQEVEGSITSFSDSLKQLKGITGAKVRAMDKISRLPLAKHVVGPSPVAKMITVNQHVEQIGKKIDAGIELMKSNIKELHKLLLATTNEIGAMRHEIQYVDLLTKELETIFHEDPEIQSNPQLAERVQIQVMRRLEEYGLVQKGLMSVLMASTNGIQHQLTIHHGVIDNATSLRRVAQPAISITLAVRIAAQDAKRVIRSTRNIRNQVREAVEAMVTSVEEGNLQLIELYRDSALAADHLHAQMNRFSAAQDLYDTKMRELYEIKRAENRKFDPVLRAGWEAIKDRTLSASMDMILGDPSGTPPPKP